MDPSPVSPDSAVLEETYDYLAEPNENLLCPICCNPFLDPVMCESADHIFCRICLIKSLEISSTCPIDRLPLSLSLVTPAPKILARLVDELLVACPYKSKFGCSFVCQRDLMSTHCRSHQYQHHSSSHSISEQQPSSEEIFSQPNQHLIPRPSSQMRFKWLSGRATLVDDQQSPPPISDLTLDQSDSSDPSIPCSPLVPSEHSNQDSQLLEPCPFKQFGCQFMGSPEVIKHDHLSVTDSPQQLAGLCDHSHCRFSSVQDILKSFQNLERRNIELKEQLSQSLVKQDKLVSALQRFKLSFRQMWRSHQSSDQPLTPPLLQTPPSFESSHPTTRLDNPTLPPSSIHPFPSPGYLQLPGTCTSPRRSSDGCLPTYSSRLNYDISTGNRLKDFHPPLPAYPCQQCQHLSSPPHSASNSSPWRKTIRVSTFVQQGDVVTPTVPLHSAVVAGSPAAPAAELSRRGRPTRPPGRGPSAAPDGSGADGAGTSARSMVARIVQMIDAVHRALNREDGQADAPPPELGEDLQQIRRLLDRLGRAAGDRSSAALEPRPASCAAASSSAPPLARPPSAPSPPPPALVDLLKSPPADRRHSSHLKL